ncbi:uncharacterized protein C8orf90 homolog [Alligator mississippiensis]|uniref:uncharacterized protein C8orf90 homolog n=1 Tax=Alligator mississippiensis TaxID=8496 RepID=UPI002877B4A0|nr:uncharacterized protein C8orf90 homolog [Alligator mississippiensis]
MTHWPHPLLNVGPNLATIKACQLAPQKGAVTVAPAGTQHGGKQSPTHPFTPGIIRAVCPRPSGGDRGSPALPGHPPAGSLEPLGAQMVPGAFPDIYDGDSRQWEAHFRGIQRAYQELGKAEDFAIRVLTEDFTLPFPFAWPPASPPDCASCSFFLRPGCPVPRFLQPLHTTAQAFVKKRQLEQLALRYAHQAGTAMETGATPTSPREPTADGRGPAQPHCSPQ